MIYKISTKIESYYYIEKYCGGSPLEIETFRWQLQNALGDLGMGVSDSLMDMIQSLRIGINAGGGIGIIAITVSLVCFVLLVYVYKQMSFSDNSDILFKLFFFLSIFIVFFNKAKQLPTGKDSSKTVFDNKEYKTKYDTLIRDVNSYLGKSYNLTANRKIYFLHGGLGALPPYLGDALIERWTAYMDKVQEEPTYAKADIIRDFESEIFTIDSNQNPLQVHSGKLVPFLKLSRYSHTTENTIGTGSSRKELQTLYAGPAPQGTAAAPATSSSTIPSNYESDIDTINKAYGAWACDSCTGTPLECPIDIQCKTNNTYINNPFPETTSYNKYQEVHTTVRSMIFTGWAFVLSIFYIIYHSYYNESPNLGRNIVFLVLLFLIILVFYYMMMLRSR
jgi:hypothetical protein